MSTEPQDRDIESATEKLASDDSLIYDAIMGCSSWRNLMANLYDQSGYLRDWFAVYHDERIDTLARQIAAERAQEEADEAAEDARWENAA